MSSKFIIIMTIIIVVIILLRKSHLNYILEKLGILEDPRNIAHKDQNPKSSGL